jgi:tellurite resistance protein
MNFRDLFHSAFRGAAPRDTFLPDIDEAADFDMDAAREVEGQRFMIEYQDGAGHKSFRRIVLQHVTRKSDGSYLLQAFCLERRAPRTFRADSILSCIDMDGEIFDPRDFLKDNVGIDPEGDGVDVIDNTRLRALRDHARPHAQLLAALSRSDGNMHPAEISVARYHCERICDGLEPTLDECELLSRRFHRIRPTPEQIDRAIDRMRERPIEEITLFLQAAQRVIEADGRLHPEEINMLNAFAEELTGCGIA